MDFHLVNENFPYCNLLAPGQKHYILLFFPCIKTSFYTVYLYNCSKWSHPPSEIQSSNCNLPPPQNQTLDLCLKESMK